MATPNFATDDRGTLEDPPLDPDSFTSPGPLNSRSIQDILLPLLERGVLPSASPPVLVASDGYAVAAFREGGDTGTGGSPMWRFWSPTCLLVVLGPSVPDGYAGQKVLLFAGELTEAFSFPGFSSGSVDRLLAFDTPLVRLQKSTLPGAVPFLELAGGPCVHPLFNSHLPVAAPVAWIEGLVLPYNDSLAALPVGYTSGPRGGSSGTYQLSDACGSLCSFPTLDAATRSFAYANAQAWNSVADVSDSGPPSSFPACAGGSDAGARRVPPMTFIPWTASPGGGGVPDHVPLKPDWFSRGLSGWFDSTSGCSIPTNADVLCGGCTCDRSGTTRACAPFECAWLNAGACLRAGAPPAVLRWISSDPKRKVATHPRLHRVGRLPGPMFEHPPGNFVPISSRLAKTLAAHFDDPDADPEDASFVVADIRFNAKLFRKNGIPVPSVSSGEARFSARVYDGKFCYTLCSAAVHRLPDYVDDARTLCSLAPPDSAAATVRYLDAAERHPLVRVTLSRSTAARHLGGRPFEYVWVEISVISTTAGCDGVLPKVCAILVPVRITAGFLYRKRPGTPTKVDDWPDDLVLVPLLGAPEAVVRAAVACGPFEASIADRTPGRLLAECRSLGGHEKTAPACKRQCLDEGLGSASSETSVAACAATCALFLVVSSAVLDRPEHSRVSEVCEFGPNELQQFLALSQVVELGGGRGWTRRRDDDDGKNGGSAIVPRGGGVVDAKKIEWEFHSGCPYAGSIGILIESAALLLEQRLPTPGATPPVLDAGGKSGGSTLLEELWKLSWVDRRRLGEHLHAEKQRVVARSKWIWTKYCRSPDVLWRHRNTQAEWVCDPIRAGLPRESALGSTALVV